MGEAQEWLFEPSFNRAVKICASDARITSDAGLVLLREADQPLEERLASQPSQSRLIDMLTLTPGNRAALRDSLGDACLRHLRATGGDHAARAG